MFNGFFNTITINMNNQIKEPLLIDLPGYPKTKINRQTFCLNLGSNL